MTAMTLQALHSTSCQLRSRETCAGHIPYTRQMSSVINQSNFEMKKVFSIVDHAEYRDWKFQKTAGTEGGSHPLPFLKTRTAPPPRQFIFLPAAFNIFGL